MKSQAIRITFCLVLAATFMVSGAWALSAGRMQIQVPFSFYAVNQLLPAGNYWISPYNNGRALKIQRHDGPEYAIVLSLPTNVAPSADGNYLLFYRYGSDNFLRTIHSSEIAIQGSLWKSTREKELAATFAKANPGDKRMAGPVKVTLQIKGD